jgi:hypothetical protein
MPESVNRAKCRNIAISSWACDSGLLGLSNGSSNPSLVWVGRLFVPMQIFLGSKVEEPFVSDFNLGAILGETSLVNGSRYFAEGATEKDFIRNQYK